ncbi:anti-sigma factor domain-containing protein [Nonomuraea bangladeshensis]|uniref:anti-sigma factor domain-containing protein n=1 Tax=Nonomuraea bangladeshensis TaxID=404385 RepID=UPI003C2C0735
MDDDLHALSGAYAVDALPYADWVVFEEHLRGCAGCGTEVRRLRETAARLAGAVAVNPPPGLRPRLLAAARRPSPRPMLPLLGDAPARGDGLAPPPVARPWAGEGRRRKRGQGWGREQGPGQGRGWPARMLAGLAAVCAAAAVGLGAVAVDARRDSGGLAAESRRLAEANQRLSDANQRLSDANQRLAGVNRQVAEANQRLAGVNRQVAVLLAASDARTVRRPVASGGTATLVVSRSAGRLLFTSSGLPSLPESRGYELWLMGPGGPRPAGLLGRAEGGVTAPVLVTPLRGDERVALTVEPARGSPRPTTDPILLADLPAA